jgi:periplasmic protein TonB
MSRRRLVVVIRVGAGRSRWSRFVTGSAAAHAAVLAGILVVPLFHRAPRPMEDAMVVALAGPIGGAPAARLPTSAPPPASPPAAAPAPPPKEAHTVKELPPPKPKEEKKKEPKKEEPRKEASPAPSPPPAQTPSPADSAPKSPASGLPAAGPTPGATGVTASVGSGEAALGWYQAAVRAALESAWIKPYIDDQRQTYSVAVAFEIARDGTTRNIRIVQPSGVPSLDRSAVRAVMEASPLPAIPPTWTGDILPATMRFDLTLDAR